MNSHLGILLRRSLDILAALKLGVSIGLDEILADEFLTMTLIEEERDKQEREKLPNAGK